MELNLKDIFNIVWHRLWIVLLVSFVVAALMLAYTAYGIVPVYQSSTKVMISDENQSTSLILTNKNTYAELILADKTYELANLKIKDSPYTPNQLRSMISYTSPEDSQMITIVVNNSDPQHAQTIARVVAESFSEVIAEKEFGKVSIINDATYSESPISPSKVQNTAIGFMLGFIITAVFFIIKEIYNTKVITEADLSAVVNVPIIGAIPLISSFPKTNERTEEGQK